MLYARKALLSLAVAVSMSGAAKADLLGVGGSAGASGGLVSQMDTRTAGALGGYADIGARSHAAADAAADVWTTGSQHARADSSTEAIAGTVRGGVATGHDVVGQARAESRASLRRADRVARRAAAQAAIAADAAYETSAATAGSSAGVIADNSSGASFGAGNQRAHVGAGGFARNGLDARIDEGVDTAAASELDAAADAEVESGTSGTVEGGVESTVVGSAYAN